jgi:aminopeptidase N
MLAVVGGCIPSTVRGGYGCELHATLGRVPLHLKLSSAAAGIAATLILTAPAAAADWTAGADGLGDPFFPQAGNGGYDVQHYDLDLDFEPSTGLLDGSATLRLVPNQDLDQFDLDLRDFLDVTRLEIGGNPARFARSGEQELIVTPRPKLHAGRTYTVQVDYEGLPEEIVDPDESSEGWVRNGDGAFVVNEPQGSPGWYPSNDNPKDKATFDFAITVPEGRVALGNGRLVSALSDGGRTTWRWSEDSPMATYLATATNGDFDFTEAVGPNGLPIYNAIDTDGFSTTQKATAATRFALTGEVISFFSDLYGPYPFSSVGSIIDRGGVGYALESQTKPNYDGVPSENTFVHELAHQWFGDGVTLAVWPDIWLNEGFARWSEWIWRERKRGTSAQSLFDAQYAAPATSSFWQLPPAAPAGPAEMFDGRIYARGAMTLQALRGKVGDDTFFRILRTWFADHRYGNATTDEFIALAERESGQDLGAFFTAWLYTKGKPAL